MFQLSGYDQAYPERYAGNLREMADYNEVQWLTHFTPTQQFLSIIQEKELKVFFVIRDLRPAAVSYAKLLLSVPYYIEKYQLEGMDLQDVIDVILEGSNILPKYRNYILDMMNWADLPSAQTVRFEDMVKHPEIVSAMLRYQLQYQSDPIDCSDLIRSYNEDWKEILRLEQHQQLVDIMLETG
jgi:hypothetical protein